jgi:hypothetical protein
MTTAGQHAAGCWALAMVVNVSAAAAMQTTAATIAAATPQLLATFVFSIVPSC